MGEVKQWPIRPFRSGASAGIPCSLGVRRHVHWWSKKNRFCISISEPLKFGLRRNWSVWADSEAELEAALKTITLGLEKRGFAPSLFRNE